MVFQSSRGDGASKLYQKSSSGEGSEELVLDTPRESSSAPGGVGAGANLQDWSSDGRFVVYMIRGKTGHFELWVLPLSDDRKPFPFLQTDSDQTQAQISPNGRWIAYTSNESGQDEVYIQGFPTRGSTRQVSAAGGVQPRWRRDGRELFYLASDQVLMSVPVANEPSISVGRPSALFRTRLDFLGTHAPNYLAGYDVTADGQRFLLIVPPEQPTPPITVVLNWTSALKK
jgi:Tol biopolymer transport system component